MGRKGSNALDLVSSSPAGKPSALVDTRVIYCGDNLEQLAKLPAVHASTAANIDYTRPRCVELAREGPSLPFCPTIH